MSTELEIQDLGSRLIQLEEQVAYLYGHLGIPYARGSGSAEDPRIIEQLKKGNMIEAIKIYRELYNTGLTEAKQAVEELKGRLGI